MLAVQVQVTELAAVELALHELGEAEVQVPVVDQETVEKRRQVV